MTLLGLELSDAGIVAAGGDPVKLLEVDGEKYESPGFAIPEKSRLLLGSSAAGKAHLFPRQVINRFWDQLNTEPLELKSGHAQSHAEIAFAHLAQIWDTIKMHGDAVIVAVPDYYGQEQLGLILGMARELSIPVQGFVSLPIAAASDQYPDAMLMHLDIHLHRFEIVHLSQGDQLTRESSTTRQEITLDRLYRTWGESIAEEFVRTTRFDPLHQAATEQELYDRLPAALEILKDHPSFIFELSQEDHSYRITLLRDLIKQRSGEVYDEIRRSVVQMRDEGGKGGLPVTLQLTHRIASLPGLKEILSQIDNCKLVELEPGAGARGVLKVWGQVADMQTGHSASFFTSRPWRQTKQPLPMAAPHKEPEMTGPTHVLYRDVAYRITEKPLIIGSGQYRPEDGISVDSETSGVSRKHCSIQFDSDKIILTDYSDQGTFVDGQRIDGSITLGLGQTVRLGTGEETLRLIASAERDET